MAFDSIRDFFARFGKPATHRVTVPCGAFSGLVQEIEIRELAFHACVNLVCELHFKMRIAHVQKESVRSR